MHPAAYRLESIVDRTRRLCSLPAVAVRVLELTRDPVVDAHALKACIENDPALTGKILRVVNSSLYGLASEVLDLNQALALLGTKPLKLLVLGFSLPPALFAGMTGAAMGRYWRRALSKAVAARELSRRLWHASGDDAFLAGLLQDIGMLALVQELGKSYVGFLERVFQEGSDVCGLEAESLGFDHLTLSARLLEHWGLPGSLVEAIAWRPGDPLPESGASMALAAYAAELLARVVVDRRPDALADLGQLPCQHGRIGEGLLREVAAVVEERVAELAALLDLDLPPGVSYLELLADAQAELAEAAAGAVVELAGRARRVGAILPPPDGAHRPAETDIAIASLPEKPPSPATVADRVETALAACRQTRSPLSLLLVGWLGPHGEADDPAGHALLDELCRRADLDGSICVDRGDDHWTFALPKCDRAAAVELAARVLEVARRWAVEAGVNQPLLAAGVAAVALPSKGRTADDLLAAAARCLAASRHSSGTLRSIEL